MMQTLPELRRTIKRMLGSDTVDSFGRAEESLTVNPGSNAVVALILFSASDSVTRKTPANGNKPERARFAKYRF